MSSSPTLPPPGSPVLRITGVNHHFGEGETRGTRCSSITRSKYARRDGHHERAVGFGQNHASDAHWRPAATLQDGEIEVWDSDAANYRNSAARRSQNWSMCAGSSASSSNAASVRLAHVDAKRATWPSGSSRATPIPTPMPAGKPLEYLILGDRGLDGKPQSPRWTTTSGRAFGWPAQHVAIASALINRPKLVLADQPTAAGARRQ